MHGLQKIEIVQALMAMFIPNVGALLVIMAVNADHTDIFSEIHSPRWMPPVWLIVAIWCTFYCVIGCASNIVFNKRELSGNWSESWKKYNILLAGYGHYSFGLRSSPYGLMAQTIQTMAMWLCAMTKASLITYGAHLVFSWIWGLILFYKKNIILAAMDMVLVNVSALHTTYLFYKVKSLAGYLFTPYLFWLSFVTILNCSIISVN